jgi:hypothetical protein
MQLEGGGQVGKVSGRKGNEGYEVKGGKRGQGENKRCED